MGPGHTLRSTRDGDRQGRQERGSAAEHYFRPRRDLPHEPERLTFEVRGERFVAETDRGVFSRHFLDFGSRLLLEHVDLRPGETVLDLGCGWGALGLVAARQVAPGRVVLVDINPRAVALVEKNARLNQLTNVEARLADGLQGVAGEKFRHILLNPPIRAGKKTYYPWLEHAGEHLEPGGELVVVVRKDQGAPSLEAFLRSHYPSVAVLAKKKGYVVLAARPDDTTP